VANLILTNGTTNGTAYNGAISQANEPIDAIRPVINFIWVESGNKRVGQTVRLIINSNNLNCTADPTSTVNGIPVSDPSIVFSEVGSGVYSIDYTVQEGDNDVGPGELQVSVILVKPSGNQSVPYTTVNNSSLLTIDANSPVITRMEVPSGEVGIGGVVEVTITADETGYIAGAGTVINEIPISSSRVTFTELTGGKYLLSYIVAVGDKSVPTGGLKVTLYMLDGAGNIAGPYTKLEPNSLSIYTELPTATLAGTQAICADEEAELTVYLTGRSPWSFYLSDGTGTTLYTDIYSSPYLFDVAPTQTTTYRIDLVSDANGSLNTGNGSAVVTVREKTPVEITNPITTFNVEGEPVQLLASLPGGTFSGPGVNSQTGIFDPAAADTVNSPHTIVYTYVNNFGCTSTDSALFFVLGAEGDIFIPRSFYCNYQAPFTLVASNIAGATGSFTLLNEDDEEVEGLTDKGNNTATVDPGMLEDGNYTVEYAYMDGVMFYLRESFIIESAAKPDILAPESDEYCMNEPAISMVSSVAGATFSGPGVSGNSMNGYVFDPGTANVGLNTIVLMNSSMSGCTNSDTLVIRIHPVPEFDFSVNNLCVSSNDTIFFDNTTPDKYLISSWNWDFGDSESGEKNTSTDESPWHIYNKAGQRTIRLIGQTSTGCTDTLERTINFGDSPGGNFRWANECFDGEAVVSFTSEMTSSNEITGYTWTFTSSTGGTVTRDGGKTISHTFDTLDNYTVHLRAESEIGCIGTTEKSIQLKPVLRPVATDDYLEDFSQGKGWWSEEEANSSDYLSWDFKVVNFANLNDELSRAWYTKLPSSPVLEESWVKSPCFDLSGLDRPMITLDIYRSLAKDSEGVVLQATTNGGLSWKTIGEEESGINWYSSSQIDPGPGGQPVGWSGKVPFQADAGWTKSRHDLDAFLGESSVQFRVAFASEHNSGEMNREGFAFDNVRISDRERKVLLEHFTNTSSNDTREVDGMLNGLYNWFYTDLVKLEYHTSFPGVDPFNAHNPSVPALRGLYYGVPSVPYSLLNGGYTNDLAFNYNPEPLEQTDLKSERLRDAMFSIDLQAVYESSRITVNVSVTALQDMEPDERIVHIAIYEKLITGVSTVNGAENFLNVVKTMLPNGAGTAVFGSWVKGQTRSWQYNWDYANVYDPEMIRVAAFIQNDDTREVYQAETLDTTNLTTGIENEDLRKWEVMVYPNPATDLLNVLIRVPGDRDDYEIELFDQVGRMVLTEKIYRYEDLKQINLDALNKGIYYVRIRDDHKRVLFVNKVIIMN
ncbi:MAG: T9SS type A sorting domain-containing protein, partial [Bacteroidales bacterium]|nr:T9SS type A sorting domain-containing protein [Bacteroidales bacterium]